MQGVLLFLIVPIAFWLLLAQPYEPRAALVLGALLLFGLRFLAAPFVRRTHPVKGIWTGGEIAPGCGYRVVTDGREWTFNSFNDPVRDKAAALFTFAQKLAWPLRIAFVGPVAYYVAAEFARVAGVEGVPPHATNVLVLKGVLAVAALGTFVGYRFVQPIPHHAKDPVRFPFGIHNVYLLGMRWTLAVLLVVGLWWTVDVARALAAR
ncbi:MAG: hypothetical protein ACF8XB_04500 [Planctomycetota bacterium JB042]